MWTIQFTPQGGTVHGILFLDAMHGWLASSMTPTIWGTTNGGATWTGQAGTSSVDFMNALSFVNATTGWSVGMGGYILHTADGSTWNAQTAPPANFHGEG